MTDIFLSYAHEDEARIKGIVAALEEQGWSVFWDRRIPAGETWRSYIGKALDEARCVIVAWSQYSVNSNWVTEEADDGKRRGVLVPVLLDPVEQPRGFREVQAADLTNWQPNKLSPQFDLLIKDLATRLRGAPVIPNKPDKPDPNAPPNEPSKRLIIAIAAILLLISLSIVGYLSFRTPAKEIVNPKPPLVTPGTITPKPPPVIPHVEQDPLFSIRAVIEDPDGYTNVRSMKSASSEIVTKVFEGEVFYTYTQEGNWWKIKTKDGKIGYMYKDRIHILKQ